MLFNRLHRVYAVWFQISDFAFYNELTFSTKTLAYLAYKTYKAFNAFMAFKRSRFSPFQNYRSITSFCVDWPRTIRLVYASISILSVCAIMLQMIVIQTHWNTKRLTKEFYGQKSRVRHVTRPCPCMTTSIIIKIARVISMWTPHWITVSCHGVEGPMTSGYYCAIFPFCGGGKKKKRRQKNKGILWLGYHRYPSNEEVNK